MLPFHAIVAPRRIVPCQLEYQRCQFGAEFRTLDRWFRLKCPFAPYPLAVPAQDGIGLENEHGTELGPEIIGEALHSSDEDGQYGLLEARETFRLTRFGLEHPDLLAQQDLNVFLGFGPVTDSEDIQDESETLNNSKPKPGSTSSIVK